MLSAALLLTVAGKNCVPRLCVRAGQRTDCSDPI